MTPTLSENTQAILLLTAPLLAGKATATTDLLSPGEYKRLARRLRELQHQPADLISSNAAALLRECQSVIDEGRLARLLGRGLLLGDVVDRWTSRAIWVVSRADASYPKRLKARLREDAPAVLYGCGSLDLLETGGLAVVGSRHVDETLSDYAMEVGRLAARAGRTLVSGGARGIDQAAMRGAMEAGGTAIGVLADSLGRSAMAREHRDLILASQLVLVSPYDPGAGFNVGHAMQRNKLIYAMSDASLVVSSDLNKGGTWAGASEQLDKFKFVPVYIRSNGAPSEGLKGLLLKGAIPWPNPTGSDEFASILDADQASATDARRSGLSLFSKERTANYATTQHDVPEAMSGAEVSEESSSRAPSASADHELTPADELFDTARRLILELLAIPRKDAEIARLLGVSNAQTKEWLQTLVSEGSVKKLNKPIRYTLENQDSLLTKASQKPGNHER